MSEPRTSARTTARPFPAGPEPQRFSRRAYPVGTVPRYQPSPRRTNALATASAALGAAGVALCWVPIVGVLYALLAVGFGVAGLRRGRHGGVGGRTAVTGLVLGVVSLAPAVIICVAVAMA